MGRIKGHVLSSIETMQYTANSGPFHLWWKENGVNPIKDSYLLYQQEHGWIEVREKGYSQKASTASKTWRSKIAF